MRIHGWCTGCRRVKMVRVSGHGMAMLAVRRVAEGICDNCGKGEEEQRRERTNRRG